MKVLNPKVNLEDFFAMLSNVATAVLILDYDGTLAPLLPNLKEAFPYPGMRDKIKTIMQLRHTKVVVISGRDLEGLRSLLNIEPHPELWGSHGGERLPENSVGPIIRKLGPEIEQMLSKAIVQAHTLAPDLYCEIKPLSVALHWRGKEEHMAREQSARVLEKWNVLAQEKPLEIHRFDGGIELRPQGINKGEAVKILLDGYSIGTPIAYLGDDLTDEEAFEALGENALKILTGKKLRETKADVHLIPPDELLWFFDRWISSQKKEIL